MFNILKPEFEKKLFPEFRFENLEKDWYKISRASKNLERNDLTKDELLFISNSLESIETHGSPFVRMESQGNSHQALKLRCEGMVNGFVETVKKFLNWLIERFTNIFTGKGSSGTKKEDKVRRPKELTEEEKVPKPFEPGELNKYFIYTTEEEAIKEFKKMVSNLTAAEAVRNIASDFKYTEFLLPDCSINLKDEIKTLFTDKVFSVLKDLKDGSGKGIEVASKLSIKFLEKDDGLYNTETVKTNKDDRCSTIDVSYYCREPFYSELAKSRDKVNNFNTNSLIKMFSITKVIKAIESSLRPEDPTLVSNALIAGKVFQAWMNTLLHYEKLTNELDKCLDRLDGKTS